MLGSEILPNPLKKILEKVDNYYEILANASFVQGLRLISKTDRRTSAHAIVRLRLQIEGHHVQPRQGCLIRSTLLGPEVRDRDACFEKAALRDLHPHA